MTRREIRDRIFKIVFTLEFNDAEGMQDQLDFAFDPEMPGDEEDDPLLYGIVSDEDRDYIYVAYNFYSSREKLALPKLKKGMKWYAVCDSSLKTPFYENETVCENQQYADVSPQSICILLGK